MFLLMTGGGYLHNYWLSAISYQLSAIGCQISANDLGASAHISTGELGRNWCFYDHLQIRKRISI